MRDHYGEIAAGGARVVAVGTGNADHARALVEDAKIPFPVLVDDDAVAANAASVERVSALKLFDPASWAGTVAAWKRGYRIGMPGRRTNQLGATFVLGPGNALRYAHRDAHTADHAPVAEVLAALQAASAR